MEVTITVCSRCCAQLRPCSPRCAMGGWVHLWSERHVCNPGHAVLLLRYPERWNTPWLFAHPRHLTVIRAG